MIVNLIYVAHFANKIFNIALTLSKESFWDNLTRFNPDLG